MSVPVFSSMISPTVLVKTILPDGSSPNSFRHFFRLSFKNWEQQHRVQQNFKGPVMLIRFNKFEAIGSLDLTDEENTYTVSVSGKLRDNETHFRGETQITIIPPGFQGKQDKSSRSSAVEDLFIDHWWDQTE
jgi:hypothetical protein